MRQILLVLLSIVLAFSLLGCSAPSSPAQIAATTLPVYEFTSAICEGTSLHVVRLITEEVSCLHDYTLNVQQVKAAEAADVIIMSGAGLEVFLDDLLQHSDIIDASEYIELKCPEEEDDHHGNHSHDGHSHDSHSHDQDPHIWLSPVNAIVMAQNICAGLSARYPQHTELFNNNLSGLITELEQLQNYGEATLQNLPSRQIITFHDGFGYFADSFDLHIIETVEEESGSEASAKELIHLIETIREHQLKAIFTEVSGSTSAASIISRETGVYSGCLDMAMAGDSYFDAMYHNINTIKEALQ